MKHTNHTIESEKLGKDMHVRVYGTKGYPVIAFPTQDQMAGEWENNGMTEVFEPYVESGRVQLFTVDSNDLESWSSQSEDFAARIARQEDYYGFVCEELLPYVHETNGSLYRPELAGCSLGATQATICALRRPDLFQGAIALSGMYHTSYFFGDWGNDVSYANDVNAFLPNTPADHPYIELYRHRSFAFSIGQAADEQFGVSDLHFLQETFQRLGIDGWFDFWGPECNHDWYWWKQQMAKFLPEAVRELEGVAAAEPELAKLPTRKAAPTKAAAAREKLEERAAKTEKAVRGKVSSARKAAGAEAERVAERVSAVAEQVQADASEARDKAEIAAAKATERAEKEASRAKERVEARKAEVAATTKEAKATVKAVAKKAEAKAEPTAKKASAVRKTTAKATSSAKGTAKGEASKTAAPAAPKASGAKSEAATAPVEHRAAAGKKATATAAKRPAKASAASAKSASGTTKKATTRRTGTKKSAK